jgi:hypothetical protein
MKKNNYGMYHDSQSRRDYYENFIFPKSISFFSAIEKIRDAELLTDSPVLFRNLQFGDNQAIVLKKLGEPRYVIKNEGLSSLILFYKENIFGGPVITQLHFMDDEFFSACSTFRFHNKSQIHLIKNTLFEKYGNSLPLSAVNYNRIVGVENSSINIIDNVNFNVFYVWGHEKVKRAVSEIIGSSNVQNRLSEEFLHLELLMKL